jgi:hypothetical protein
MAATTTPTSEDSSSSSPLPPHVLDTIKKETLERLVEAMRPTDERMRELDDGSVIHQTLRLPDQTTGEERDAVHLTVHPEKGLRWVAARDFEAGETMMLEEPLMYVTTVEDSRQQPLNSRPMRRLFPERPKRARSIRRLFEQRSDLFGSGDQRLPMSLEWTLTFYLVFTFQADEVRSHVSQMRRPGRFAYGEQVRQLFAQEPSMLSSMQDVQRMIAEERARRVEIDEFRRKAEEHSDDQDTREALAQDLSKLLEDYEPDRLESLVDQLERMRSNFNDARREHAETRRWVSLLRRVAPGGRDTYDDQEILSIYASVTANAIHMRSPLSRIVYGMGVYPGLSHVRHSCVPSAQVVFGENGRAHVEALGGGAVQEGTEITIDRVLADEPIIRCLATGPAWVRAVFDATAGYRCQCSECNDALNWMRASAAGIEYERGCTTTTPPASPQDLERVVDAVASVWKDPEPAEKRVELDDYVESLFFYPLSLSRTSLPTVSQTVDAVGREYAERLLSEETLTLRAYDLTRALIESAVRHPVFFDLSLGADLIDRAATYERERSELLVAAKLREQGASPELVHRRLMTMRARTRHVSFVAAVAPVINRVNEKSADMTSLRRNLMPELQEHFQERFVDQFRYTAAAIQLPPQEHLRVGSSATRSAVDRLHLESLRVAAVGMAASVLSLSECGVEVAAEKEGGEKS